MWDKQKLSRSTYEFPWNKKYPHNYHLIEEIYPNKKYIINLLINESNYLAQSRLLSPTIYIYIKLFELSTKTTIEVLTNTIYYQDFSKIFNLIENVNS